MATQPPGHGARNCNGDSRASLWFEQWGQLDEAIQHALLAQEWSRAGRLIKEGKSLGALLNFYRRSAEWLQALPDREVDRTLCARLGVVLWSALRFQEAYQAFEKALDSGLEEIEFLCLAGLTSCSDAMDLDQQRRDWYARAVQALPETPSHSRTVGLFILATLAVVHFGDPYLGERFSQGQATHPLPDSEMPVFFGGIPGMVALLRGELDEAVRHFQVFGERTEAAGHRELGRIAAGFLGCARFEQGRLKEAAGCWSRFLEGDKLPFIRPVKAYFWTRYLGTLRGLGRLDEMESALRGETGYGLDPCPVALATEVRFLLEDSRIEEAIALLGKAPELDEASFEYPRQPLYWAWIHLWGHAKDRATRQRAWRWLDLLEQKAVQADRVRDRLEALLVRAWLSLSEGQGDQALEQVRKAIEMGRPRGYVAIFMDQPVEVRRLCLDSDPSLLREASEWMLFSALSPREHEILELLRAGATNRQIAETFFLSTHTVKWHNQRIFKKLGVKNRAEALELFQD